jgi:hypothetical protein
MKNVSCNHLSNIVMACPELNNVRWINGRNQCAVANIFRNRVQFNEDGLPFLSLPLDSIEQVGALTTLLTKNRIDHKITGLDVKVSISWSFKGGSAFDAAR